MPGYFITFEGGEGSGKTTQVRLLEEALKAQGLPAIVTREPGGTPLGKLIRGILLDGNHPPIAPLTELLLYAADRAQHLTELIAPAMEKNQIVLCDRFTDATIAYQGFGRGLDLGVITELNQLATGGIQPGLSILLDCPVETGLARSKARLQIEGSSEDRFENEQLAFHERVRQGYLDLAQKNPKRFRVVDATISPQEIHQKILPEVLTLLGRKSG